MRLVAQRVCTVAVAVLAGCSSASAPVASTDATTDDSITGPSLPLYLRSFESDAEAMGDAARANDWTKASGVLGEATTNWQKVKPQVVTDGARGTTVQSIDDALHRYTADVAAKDAHAGETDANAISLVVPDLFDLYPSWPVPSDALRFDALFRSVQIDGEWNAFDLAPTDHSNVVTLWTRFRDRVASQAATRGDIPGAGTVASDLDATIAAEKSAIDARDGAGVVAQSQHGLDLVDVCEQVFE